MGILILAMAGGGLYKLAISADCLSAQGRVHCVAVNLARNQIERVKTVDPTTYRRFVETNALVDVNGELVSNGEYRRTTSVQLITNSTYEIRVQVDVQDVRTRAFGKGSETVVERITEFDRMPL